MASFNSLYCCNPIVHSRYYSGSIIRMMGVKETCQAMWYSSLVTLTNFVFAFVGTALIQKVGRRNLYLGSLAGDMSRILLL